MDVMIAVLTTGSRSVSLDECLRGIAKQDTPATIRVHVVVVQNGTDVVDQTIVDEFSPIFRLHTFDVIAEARKGIPFARNAALRFALARGVEHLAFIDDDASPDPDWIRKLVSPLNAKVNAATGPQVPVFPDDAPSCLRNASIYRERQLAQGSRCKWAATNNVVFSVGFAHAHQLWFNENFLTGGSDKEFFLRFSKAGGTILWVDDAIVREPVVQDRLSIDWAVKRAYRYGSTGFTIEKSIRGPFGAIAVCGLKGLAYIAAGLVRLPAALAPKNATYVNAICSCAHGTGFLLGIVTMFRLGRYV